MEYIDYLVSNYIGLVHDMVLGYPNEFFNIFALIGTVTAITIAVKLEDIL